MTIRPAPLLTVDEARYLLASTALALVEVVTCRPERLGQLLTGTSTLRGLPPEAAAAVRAHRAALRDVADAGHGWIVGEELLGAASYAGLDAEPAGVRAA